jgi:2-methylcitrate dehydratase PrpD
MDKNLTDILVDDIYELMNEPIPEAVLLQAKGCLLDYLGVGLAGAKMAYEKCSRYLDCFGSDQRDATVIGFNRKASLHNAVLINGYSAHITELDDGHRFCNVHLGTTVIPAVLAVAEYEGLTAEDIFRGIIIGYEVAIRTLRAIQPNHKKLGHHASGTGGTIGAAMGIAAALKFSKPQMKDALSAAIASAVGFLEVQEDDSELKPYNIGRAGHDGLTAAFIARAGISGPNDMVGGNRGFFALVSDEYNIKSLIREKHGTYGIEKIYRKPYAACRHCHAPIEAVIDIRKKHNINIRDIREIKVYTYLSAIQGHDHIDIQGTTSAKLSMPYSVAVALVSGKAGLNDFLPEQYENSITKDLTKKIKVCEDKELSALIPYKRAAIVEINMNDGKRYTERVDYPKGEPENPMSKEDLENKFISLALYGGKSEKEANKIMELVWNTDDKLSELFSLLK